MGSCAGSLLVCRNLHHNLCFVNGDVSERLLVSTGLKEHLAQHVPKILRGQPNASIISISQNDDEDYCKTGADQAATLEWVLGQPTKAIVLHQSHCD